MMNYVHELKNFLLRPGECACRTWSQQVYKGLAEETIFIPDSREIIRTTQGRIIY